MKYEDGLRMAQVLKDLGDEITAAIYKTMDAKHGVVAVRFTKGNETATVEILDEPYQDDVRVYPG